MNDQDFPEASTDPNDRSNKPNETEHPPVGVPAELISTEALTSLIEEFILREGTDYGRNESEHTVKQSQIRKQLESGDIKIAFDPNSESVTLLTKDQWQKASRLIF